MRIRCLLPSATITFAVVVVACGNSGPAGGKDAAATDRDGAAGDGLAGDGGGAADGKVSEGGKGNDAATRVDATSDAAPLPGPQPTCSVPIQPADTSQPTTVVGTGSASSCTEQALDAAVAKGGVILFHCSSSLGGGAVIPITQTIQLPIDKDTVIDGGSSVAFDGGGATRIFSFNSPNYRATNTTVTLQHLDIIGGTATGTPIPTAPAPCSQGSNIDGSGAGIYVRDGKLHVIDVGFSNNHAASPGPDVGGGAIYAVGSLDVTVVGSRFIGNSGSNGGAIGSLNSDLTLVNDSFTTNMATGNGANSVNPATCSVDGGQIGNGGNAGAVAIDGGSDGTATVCGCLFSSNSAGALGGALFRTADGAMQSVNIDQTTFDSNTAVQGGGAMYIHNCNLNVTASTVSNNSAPGAGGIQADGTKIDFVNDTFSGNSATTGLGGALSLFSNGGTIQNSTFADNHADHGPGAFGAAIAGGATMTINDTIFWDNTSQDCNSPMACQDGSSSGQADLQWPNHHIACTMTADPPCASGGTTFADAALSPLMQNGGPTQTMLPQAGSPAIGAGTGCPMTDQRGVMRKPDGCTAGAVEVP
jgi:predicted outer membrane repeat protein